VTELLMNVQLDVDASAGPFADLAYQWIDAVPAVVRPDIHSALAGLPAKLTTSPGEPGSPFGAISVTRGRRGATRNPGTAGMTWLRGELDKELPERADLMFGAHDANGERRGQVLYIEARHNAEVSPGWLTLNGFPYLHVFQEGVQEQRRWLEVLFAFADRTNPGFGHISPYFTDGATALEKAFPPKGNPFTARYQEYALNECRQYLRGYSWVTVVAQELLPRLGGVERLQASGAFTQVRPLTAGGAWLQATADYRDFDDAALTRVFEAVAPALRPGLPRDTGEPHFGQHRPRVVLRDAAELGAR
jgi:hypothetical protein